MEPIDPHDPLDDLDAWEQWIEPPFEPSVRFPDPDVFYMDDVGRMAGDLEATVEAALVPPPATPEAQASIPRPESGAPPFAVSVPSGPLRPPEPERLPWVAMEPPPAARPSITRDGIGPPDRQSRGGGGRGRSGAAFSSSLRPCAESREPVDEIEDCPRCTSFGDWAGDGRERCYHDWREEAANDEEE